LQSTQIIYPKSIKWLVLMDTNSALCEVLTDILYMYEVNMSIERVKLTITISS
jgi:hypothetical protein